jgi:hypothetical protein
VLHIAVSYHREALVDRGFEHLCRVAGQALPRLLVRLLFALAYVCVAYRVA